MTEPTALVAAIQAVSAPVTKLIEVTAAGTGAVLRPWLIRRGAKAEADALRIHAEGAIERQELLQIAQDRMIARESNRIGNIQSIVEEAVAHLSVDVSAEPVRNDWAVRFFQACEDTTDDQMRTLWSKILAGEITRPNSFSLRTLSIVRDLSISEATHFNALCLRSFAFEGSYYPFILDPNARAEDDQRNHAEFLDVLHTQERLSYATYQDLEAAGLLHFEPSMIFSTRSYFDCELRSKYYKLELSRERPPGETSIVNSPMPPERIPLGFVRLSRSGEELLRIAEGPPPSANEYEEAIAGFPDARSGYWYHRLTYIGPPELAPPTRPADATVGTEMDDDVSF